MKLWLDDLRNPVDYGYPNALWCKNLSSFYSLLKFMSDSDIDSIHFDNDLGGDEKITMLSSILNVSFMMVSLRILKRFTYIALTHLP